MSSLLVSPLVWGTETGQQDGVVANEETYDYLVLATTRTSTMERELNEATEDGYRFQKIMGGETALGGAQIVALMMRASLSAGTFSYRLLAAGQTSTMQNELQEVGREGYDNVGQTVFESFFGGEEVVVILELDNDAPPVVYEYLLLATSRTSTLEEELVAVGQRGFKVVGLTVGETAFGGDELVVIARRVVAE